MYKVSTRITDIRSNTTIQPDGISGGWKATNIGTGAATIDGFPLPVGETIDMTNLGAIPFIYNSQIVIELESGAVIHLMQLQYNKEG